MIKELVILTLCLLVVVSLSAAEDDLAKTMAIQKPSPVGEMDMMETAETKYKGGKGKGGGGGHYYGGGGGGHYHGGGGKKGGYYGGGGKKGGYKGGKFKKG